MFTQRHTPGGHEHDQSSHGRGGGDDKTKTSYPGAGYSENAFVKNGVIHTDNVNDAARALYENRRVELNQPRGLSVLLDRLGEIAKEMIAKGEQAPNFNLCNVTVRNSSLFCASSKGIPRVQMPQLTVEETVKFVEHLKSKGYTVSNEEQFASYLRATQNELNGAKVAGIAKNIANLESQRTIVSKDDYILDGHHRWAAKVGLDAQDNILDNDTKIPISRVNISIIQLLEEAEIFTGGKGKRDMADKGLSRARVIVKSRAGERRLFMQQCMTTMTNDGESREDAREICELLWDEQQEFKSGDGHMMIHKTKSAAKIGKEFVLSDESIDRSGDVILASGWDFKNFNKNPIALFNHRNDFPVGRWSNIRVEKGELRGHLTLAPLGTSERIDEVIRLIDADILQATSVGFLAKESKPSGKGGTIYTKQELAEVSIVTIPMNPNALAVAKSLNISRETMDMVFAEQGNEGNVRKDRGSRGEYAENLKNRKSRTMASPLTQRIKDTQDRIVKLQNQLDEHLKSADDENPEAGTVALTEELTQKISDQEAVLKSLEAAEQKLAAASSPDHDTVVTTRSGGRDMTTTVVRNGYKPFAVPAAKKPTALDYLWRSLTIGAKHHYDKGRTPILDLIKETYGEDDATRIMVRSLITRAATVPADTVTVGWAAELVTTAIGEFMDALTPVSIYARLSSMGGRFTFGRNGIVSMPTRAATPTIAGSFVGQGSPIPVRQGQFSAVTMTPKKMAVISTFTRELAEHSTPAIEQLIRQAIIEDTAVAIDAVLLDNAAATAVRPAGLLNGVVALGPTAGANFAALVGDLGLMAGALLTSTAGVNRQPVWLMHPTDVLKASLLQNAGGDLPFREELGRGTLLGYPVIQSSSVTADTMFLIDAADFISATDDSPRFDVSDQATLHMEDTTPLAIGTAGTPNTVAAPVRSLWQTDTLGIRMILPMNWAMRRAGMVQTVTNLSWN